MPDTIADHDADPPVGQLNDVVPVAADLERAGGGFVTDGEPRGQPGRAEDRALQRERRLALLIDLVGAVQRLAEIAADQAEQGPVLGGEHAAGVELDPDRQGARRMLEPDAGPSWLARRRRQQGLVPQCGERVPQPFGQCLPRAGGTRRRHGHLVGSGPGRGGDVPGTPQPAQSPSVSCRTWTALPARDSTSPMAASAASRWTA